jgi:N-acyl-D-aspartate/D-glutamate deacylase
MILIKNVKIVDGSGGVAYPGDVLISRDKISAIGHFPNRKADLVVDGLGHYLTPGFIDVNSTIDHDLTIFNKAEQKEVWQQGITSAIGGQGGASLAPLLYGSLKSIQKWTDVNQINVNWHSFREFAKAMRAVPLAVNFGSLVGHSTIRRDIIGEHLADLTDMEMKVFKTILQEALQDGALGFSSGLNYAHTRQTPQRELKELADITGQNNGLYATHLRNEKENLVDAVNEISDIYKTTGTKTIISRFLPLLGFEKEFDLAREVIERGGDGFLFVVSVTETDIVPIYTLLPIWAQKGNLQQMYALIKDSANEKRIVEELPKLKNDSVIIKAQDHPYLKNKTLKDFADNRELTPGKALLELMKISQLKTLLAVKTINYEKIAQCLDSNKALITGPFGNFWTLADQKRWPLEKIVAKITSLPARIFNLKNRGLIKENYFADLVMLKNGQVEKVFVNGELASGQFLQK